MSEEKQVGFVTMGDQRAGADAIPEIGIGMLGYAFMGRAHSNALKKIAYVTWPPPYIPRLVAIAGRTEEAVREAARRYGYEKYSTRWEDVVSDPDVQIFDNGGPNDAHLEPTVAAAKAGKHIICEKPLGRDAEESYEIWRQVAATGVKHMTAFNYRFYPAIILAKQLIEAGELGEIYHFRARYHQEWVMDPKFPKVWRLDKKQAGSGALGDLGAHIIDQARYLIGEPTKVTGLVQDVHHRSARAAPSTSTTRSRRRSSSRTAPTARSRRRASRPGARTRCAGRSTARRARWCSTPSARTSCWRTSAGSKPGASAQGFRNVLVSEADHPFWEHWWPHGHMIGWEDNFVHELLHLLTCVKNDEPISPRGATLEDGYRCAEICDAIVRSHETGQRQTIEYRSL